MSREIEPVRRSFRRRGTCTSTTNNNHYKMILIMKIMKIIIVIRRRNCTFAEVARLVPSGTRRGIADMCLFNAASSK